MADKKIQNGVFYQIYVGSFADGNGDGIGDLRGIINKLDYLNDGKGGGLGITGIWLCPIHEAKTYHKYDIMDYYSVDPEYGTMEDLEELIKEAKKRGIAIILDLVFNCMCNSSPMFLDALNNKDSKYRQYFYFEEACKPMGLDLNSVWMTLPSWRETDTPHGKEKYLGLYHEIMPDLNFHNPEVRKMCKDIAGFWLAKGVAGFRLDSAMHLFSVSEVRAGEDYHDMNIEWWTEFYEHCKSIKPDVYLVGEIWDEHSVRARYMKGLKSDFHFYIGGKLEKILKDGRDKDGAFIKGLKEEYDEYVKVNGTDYIDVPFISNHDELRFCGHRIKDMRNLKLAANIYLTLEGLPFVYYGEETGMPAPEGLPAKTAFKWHEDDMYLQSRTAFPWGEKDKAQTKYIYFEDESLIPPDVKTQTNDKNSLLNYYKALIAFRKNTEGLNNGRFSAINPENSKLLCYEMTGEKESLVVIHNLSDLSVTINCADYGAVDAVIIGKYEKRHEKFVLEGKTSCVLYKTRRS